MRTVLTLLTLWLTLIVFSISDQFGISREPLGKLMIVLALGCVSTIVHETGHALAAWKLGYKIRRIGVLPFEYDFGRKKFGAASIPRSSDLAGYVVAEYPGREPPGRRALMAFAGPAAEALLALSLFASVAIISGPLSETAVVPDIAITTHNYDAAAKLPSEDEMATAMDKEAHASENKILTGLATMLGALALGSCLINLLPFGRSDGQLIWGAIRQMRRDRTP